MSNIFKLLKSMIKTITHLDNVFIQDETIYTLFTTLKEYRQIFRSENHKAAHDKSSKIVVFLKPQPPENKNEIKN